MLCVLPVVQSSLVLYICELLMVQLSKNYMSILYYSHTIHNDSGKAALVGWLPSNLKGGNYALKFMNKGS